jgi:hypothetical protein
MGLLSMFRKAPEQVGAAPNTVNPAAHLTGQAPPAMLNLEWTGADYDTVATRPAPPSAARTWRAPAAGAPATNAVPLSDQQHTTAEGPHLTPGEPDRRRAEADRSAGPLAAELRPLPETVVNARPAVVMEPEAAPERPRQGFTGADPTRAARFPIAYTVRPFDKGIADHPGAVTKAGQANPLASRPPERKRLIGGRPSAGGSEGTGMVPVGPSPNTVRVSPAAWDTRIVNPGVQAPATSSRARGWRAQ